MLFCLREQPVSQQRNQLIVCLLVTRTGVMDNGDPPPSLFRFLLTPYSNFAISVEEDRQLVTRRLPDNPNGIVYLNRPLSVKEPLVLQVHQVTPAPTADHSFVFGITFCDADSVCKYAAHRKAVCQKDGPCGNDSQTHVVKGVSRVGEKILFSRQATGAISIQLKVGDTWKCYTMRGTNQFLKHTVYPFLVLSGDVSGIRIIPDVEHEPQPQAAKPPVVHVAQPVTSAAATPPPVTEKSPTVKDSPIKSAKVANETTAGVKMPDKRVADPRPLTPASTTSSSAHETDTEDGYNFLYSSSRGGRQRVVQKWKLRKTKRLSKHNETFASKVIYLTPSLQVGKKLIFRAEAFEASSTDCSLTFGVTVWDRSLASKDLPASSICNYPNLHFQIPHFTTTGIIYFELLPDKQFINFTIGITSYRLKDERGLFHKRPAFPFIKLNGTISKIVIVDEADIKLPSVVCVADFKDERYLKKEESPASKDLPVVAAKEDDKEEETPVGDQHDRGSGDKQDAEAIESEEVVIIDSDSEKDSVSTPTDGLPEDAKCNGIPEPQVTSPETHAKQHVTHERKPITWYSNENVQVVGDVISRNKSSPGPKCISGTAMLVGDEISFQVLEVDTSACKSLDFALTQYSEYPNEYHTIPVTGQQLDEWSLLFPGKQFKAQNILPVLRLGARVTIKRTENAILLTTGSDATVKLMDVKTQEPLFPRLNMASAVTSIRLLIPPEPQTSSSANSRATESQSVVQAVTKHALTSFLIPVSLIATVIFIIRRFRLNR